MFCRGDIVPLKEMFPDWQEETLKNLLELHGSADAVALHLSTTSTNTEVPEETCDDEYNDISVGDDEEDSILMRPSFAAVTLPSLLSGLRANLSNEKVKLKVDQDDLLNDAMAFYKDTDFDPRCRLRVIYNGQPAADTGGVTRHFFTQLLGLIATEFFEEEQYEKPIYNATMVACGIMKLCGIIVAHSVVLGGPGLPVFSPGIYHCLATGNLEETVSKVTIDDCSPQVKSFIDMVNNI